jgi:hypothetical protein
MFIKKIDTRAKKMLFFIQDIFLQNIVDSIYIYK